MRGSRAEVWQQPFTDEELLWFVRLYMRYAAEQQYQTQLSFVF